MTTLLQATECGFGTASLNSFLYSAMGNEFNVNPNTLQLFNYTGHFRSSDLRAPSTRAATLRRNLVQTAGIAGIEALPSPDQAPGAKVEGLRPNQTEPETRAER